MPKKTGFFSSIFSKKKKEIETDAAPIRDKNEISSEENNITTSSSSLEYQQQNINASLPPESISPIKQHMLVTQEIGNNRTSENDLQLIRNNNATVNNIERQNVLQFSNINGLHIGNSYSFSNPSISDEQLSNTKNSGPQENRSLKKTKTIEAMMKSNEPLEYRTMNMIAEHMENWEDVARKLKFSEGQIQHLALDNYMKGTKEIVYQLLLDWSQNEDDACLGLITKILWRTSNQQTVYYLKELWKSISTASV